MKYPLKTLALAVVFLIPTLAMAAGFAKDPIFLSKTPVVEGQSVHVYAVISNTDASAFTGTLVFYDNKSKIGSVGINLAAGATQTASILWTPTAGAHPLSAQLVAGNGTVAEQVAQNFTVNAKSQPASNNSLQSAVAIDSSASIQSDIAGVSPQLASVTQPAFSAIDSAREAIANTLDGQIASAKAKVAATPKPGIVEGASTGGSMNDTKIENPTTGFWYWLYLIYLYVLQAVRWLVGNAGVFYPVLAIAFLYLIYRLYRRFRRRY